MLNSTQETKQDPVQKLYQQCKPKNNAECTSDFQIWTQNIRALQKVLINTKIQTQQYAEQTLKSSNYFKEIFVPKLMDRLQRSTQGKIKIDCKKIKKIIRSKWQAINQNYFDQASKSKENICFMHPRLGMLFRELTPETINSPKKFDLKDQILADLISNYPKKMLTKQFIALTGFMFSGKQNNKISLINISKLSDNTADIEISFKPNFKKKSMQVLVQQKMFTNANTEKLLNKVKGQPAYNNIGSQDFKEDIKQSQIENGDFAFSVLGCCLQLEYLNQYVRQKNVEQYIDNLALFEGHNLCKGVILGELSQLYLESSQQTDNTNNQEQQDLLNNFLQFFDFIFTDKCDEIKIVKGICKGIKKQMSENTDLTIKDVIKNYWCKPKSL